MNQASPERTNRRATNVWFRIAVGILFIVSIAQFILLRRGQGIHFDKTAPVQTTGATDLAGFPPISETKTSATPSPYYNRMVHTHVGKSGGSYLINVMKALQERNGFKYINGGKSGFNPPKQKMIAVLKSMENNTIYNNHANYVEGFDDYQWVSVIRDPLALMNSVFYYMVDKGLRGKKADEVIDRRRKDTVCGCFGLEFDECINTKYKNNCTIELAPQMAYFCETTDPNCSLEHALSHAQNYLLIGMTEEMKLTMSMLEKLSPWVFRGQSEALSSVKKRSTHLFNPITNTTLNGAISTRTRNQIKERAINYKDEIQFYDAMKIMFWRKAVELEFGS